MKVVLSAVGQNNVGIVHAISGVLTEYHLDILDITQTIMDGCFTMMCLLEFDDSQTELGDVQDALAALGQEINIQIQLQSQKLFDRMYQI
ncbi:MAG: ACT domain-containing protein [Aerococcus sp.]|nr:ACT domain-containing protein [Aerococcus sp.]